MYDLIYDRNMNDKIIGKSIKYIELYILKNSNNNISKEWNKEFNTNNKICILWGIYCKFKKNTLYRKYLFNKYKYKIILEQGFFNRKNYISFSINNLYGLSIFTSKKCDSKRFDKLNLNVKKIDINLKGYILICGQKPYDTQIQDIDYNKWLNTLFKNLKKNTNRKIVFRNHPLYNLTDNLIHIPEYINIDKNLNLKESLKNTYCVISYNSNALIESLIGGIPIICLNKMSVIYDLCENNLENINNIHIPKHNDILQRFYDLSYRQWSYEELKNGNMINYVEKNIIFK